MKLFLASLLMLEVVAKAAFLFIATVKEHCEHLVLICVRVLTTPPTTVVLVGLAPHTTSCGATQSARQGVYITDW